MENARRGQKDEVQERRGREMKKLIEKRKEKTNERSMPVGRGGNDK